MLPVAPNNSTRPTLLELTKRNPSFNLATQEEIPWVSIACDYDAQPRLDPSSTQTTLPFQANANVNWTALLDGADHKGWIPIFEGEKLVNPIAGGGSGASVALIRNSSETLVVRKFIMANEQKEAAFAQNQEAIGQATLVGKEPASRLKSKLADILKNRASEIEEFIQQTRPLVTKRFLLLSNSGTQRSKDAGCGYDQTAFTESKEKTAPEFAKVIQNNNIPLSQEQLQSFVGAQMDLALLFEKFQAAIFLEPLEPSAGKALFHSTYLAKFEKRLSSGFAPELLTPQYHVPLALQSLSHQPPIMLNELLLAPKVQVNGQEYDNPLQYAHKLKDTFASKKEGFLLHGDLQQTNAIYVAGKSDGQPASLKCIDNRTSETQDYLSDLSKMLWGPEFVAVMEDMLDVECTLTPGKSAQIQTQPKPGTEYSVNNLQQFGQGFARAVENHFQTKSDDHPTALNEMNFTAGVQYLRDLGFVLSRLENAIDHENTPLIQKLSRRVIADFASATVMMAKHQNNGISTDFQQYNEKLQ